MDKKDAKDLLVLINSYNLEPVTILHPHLYKYKIVITKIKDVIKVEYYDPAANHLNNLTTEYYAVKGGNARLDDAAEEMEAFLER